MDFIITWVNGEDPEWIKEYLKYKKEDSIATHKARFRNWENLAYWFRGVEKFAPWVNKIHFVTNDKIPKWLNPHHPKLNIVRHRDFMPKEYLPTFNSSSIELNFHRIKGLGEEYVNFNDDIFILNSLRKEDFFKDGKICDTALIQPVIGWNFNLVLLRNMSIIKKHFIARHVMLQKPSNWFSLQYGIRNSIRNLLHCLASGSHLPGFYNFHLPQPTRKSTLEMLWEKEYATLDESSKHTFRSYSSVNQYLTLYWEFASNNFNPINKEKLGKTFELHAHSIREAGAFIRKQTKPLVCVNDHPNMKDDFKTAKQEIINSLEQILPDKSEFEI